MKQKVVTSLVIILSLVLNVSAQEYQKEQEIIKKVKLSGKYLYGEATMPSYEAAKETAQNLLLAHIDVALADQFKMLKEDRIDITQKAKQYFTEVRLKRANLERVFVFLAKDSIKGEKETPANLIDSVLVGGTEPTQILAPKDSVEIAVVEAPMVQPQNEALKRDSLAKVKTQKAKKKVDVNKDGLIASIEEFCKANNLMVEPQTIKSNQISFKDLEGNYYSLKLTKHKAKPDGYKE